MNKDTKYKNKPNFNYIHAIMDTQILLLLLCFRVDYLCTQI
jgi:hypothetical protein